MELTCATTTDLGECGKKLKQCFVTLFSHSTPLDNLGWRHLSEEQLYVQRSVLLHSLPPEELGARKGRIEAVADAIF